MEKFKEFMKKVSDNSELILAGAVVVLTVVVVRSVPRVSDVMLTEDNELLVEFSNGSSNAYSLRK